MPIVAYMVTKQMVYFKQNKEGNLFYLVYKSLTKISKNASSLL